MVEPITMAILAGGSAGAKVIGGLLASQAAQEKAEFFSKAYAEQEKLNEMVFAHDIRQDIGARIAAEGARGVSGGSVRAAAFNSVFAKQLRRVERNQQIRFQAVQQEITGDIASQNALLSGLTGALGTAVQAGFGINDKLNTPGSTT